MLTQEQKIEQLESKVLAMETQMKFVIEMIGAPDSEAYDKEYKILWAKKQEEMQILDDYLIKTGQKTVSLIKII